MSKSGLLLAILVAGAAFFHLAAAHAQSQPVVEADVARESLTSLPADIPVRRSRGSSADNQVSWAYGVWAVVALAACGWILLRRRGVKGDRPDIGLWPAWLRKPNEASTAPKIISQTRLTGRHSVHVVHWRSTEYFLGCSDDGIQVIAHHPIDGAPTTEDAER